MIEDIFRWSRIASHYTEILSDVYPQPLDDGHSDFSREFFVWAKKHIEPGSVVADLGCGQGNMKDFIESVGATWYGITVGEDYTACMERGLSEKVFPHDYNFLPVADSFFYNLLSRHSLEHSPMPVLTLMEWNRICYNKLFLVLPSAEYWGVGGKNHYSVLFREQWEFLFKRSGWVVEDATVLSAHNPVFLKHYYPGMLSLEEKLDRIGDIPIEYWYVLSKGEKITE